MKKNHVHDIVKDERRHYGNAQDPIFGNFFVKFELVFAQWIFWKFKRTFSLSKPRKACLFKFIDKTLDQNRINCFKLLFVYVQDPHMIQHR